MLGARDRVAVLCTVSAERYGQYRSAPAIHLWRVRNDRPEKCASSHWTSTARKSSGPHSRLGDQRATDLKAIPGRYR